jgi:hypothetical protein
MFFDIHTYIRTYIHAYIYTCMHTYIHTYNHTYIHTYIHILPLTEPAPAPEVKSSGDDAEMEIVGENTDGGDVGDANDNSSSDVEVPYYERVLLDIDAMYLDNSVDGTIQLGLKHTNRMKSGHGGGYGGPDVHGSLTIRSS